LSSYDITTYQFKVVVISGTLTDALRRNNINVNDYSALSKFANAYTRKNTL